MTLLLSKYLEQKDEKIEKKRKYKQRFNVKARWSKQQKKQREEIYKERTDISYGPGIAVVTELSNDKGGIQKCKCGSTLHSQTSHRDCPLK
jgi:hypothetical protein